MAKLIWDFLQIKILKCDMYGANVPIFIFGIILIMLLTRTVIVLSVLI